MGKNPLLDAEMDDAMDIDAASNLSEGRAIFNAIKADWLRRPSAQALRADFVIVIYHPNDVPHKHWNQVGSF